MQLAAIWRHPVKSLGAEALERVTLRAGEALPGDRAHAIAHGRTDFDPDNPKWEDCSSFLRVANVPALARPVVSYDPGSRVLVLTDGDASATYDLRTGKGRDRLAAWAGEVAGSIRPGPYFVADAPGVSMTDVEEECPSVMSMASLRDLSRTVGADLDPRRFRGNLWIDGDRLEPWAELGWEGRTLRIGAARLTVTEPIDRCLATAANPETGARSDNPLPALKAMGGGAPLFGVLAHVREGGPVAVGDAVTLD